MIKAALTFLALALALPLGCSKKGSSPPGAGDAPGSVGAVHLTETNLFPQQYRAAAENVAKAVDKPEEFYASVEETKSTGELVFHLWHQDAFKPENKNVVGNPGGKCRDVTFDPKKGEVTKTLFWQ